MSALSVISSKFSGVVNNPTVGKLTLKVSEKAPTAAIYVGIAGMVVSGVMACRRSVDAHRVRGEAIAKRHKIRNYVEKNPASEEAATFKKDITAAYARECLEYARIYGPAITVATISIASILWGNHELSRRNAVLASAYTALHNSFTRYQDKVIETFGVEAEQKMRDEMTYDIEGGVDYSKPASEQLDISGQGPYARIFDETCQEWHKDATMNQFHIRSTQNYLNELLRARGYVFLNEAYKALGVPQSQAGQMVGWVRDDRHPDTLIDFGMDDLENESVYRFVNGYEDSVWIRPNVMGDILSLINMREV